MFIAVTLPDGRRRLIRRAATDRERLPATQGLTPRVSARTLLALARGIRGLVAASSSEITDAAPSPQVCIAAIDPAPCAAATAMAVAAAHGAGSMAAMQTWGDGAASVISLLEAATKPRMPRASASSVRADTRGVSPCVAGRRSRSVAARRIKRRRPSGKVTAMNKGPREQPSETTARCWPNKG